MASGLPVVLSSIEKQLGRLAGLLAVLGGLALAALMVMTIVAVFWRYVLNNPIFGIEDVSVMILTVVVAASVAYGAHHQAHVSVDIIEKFFGHRTTRVTDAIARFLGTGIVGTATYALFTKGSCGLPCGAITNNLAIVHTPFFYMLGVAMGSYTLLLGVQFLIGLTGRSGAASGEAQT